MAASRATRVTRKRSFTDNTSERPQSGAPPISLLDPLRSLVAIETGHSLDYPIRLARRFSRTLREVASLQQVVLQRVSPGGATFQRLSKRMLERYPWRAALTVTASEATLGGQIQLRRAYLDLIRDKPRLRASLCQM